jgi:hypothetical protein
VSKPQTTVRPLNAHTQQQSQIEYTPESVPRCEHASWNDTCILQEDGCIVPWHQPCLPSTTTPRSGLGRGSRSRLYGSDTVVGEVRVGIREEESHAPSNVREVEFTNIMNKQTNNKQSKAKQVGTTQMEQKKYLSSKKGLSRQPATTDHQPLREKASRRSRTVTYSKKKRNSQCPNALSCLSKSIRSVPACGRDIVVVWP